MKQVFRRCFFSLLTVLGSSFATADVIIGVPNYAPFYNERGEGLLSEVFIAAFGAEGVEVQVQTVPIRRGVKSLIEHEIDAYAAGNLFANPEQLKQLTWVPVINALPCWFAIKASDNQTPFSPSLDELKQFRLGVIVNSPYLARYRQHGLNIVEIQSPQQLVGMVERKRIDLFEATLLTGLLMFKEHSAISWESIEFTNWDTLQLTLAFSADRQRSTELSALFVQGLSTIRSNGQLVAILESYWGEGNIPYTVLDLAVPDGRLQFDLQKFWSYAHTPTGRIKAPD